jgi:hypothetical protein
MRCEATEHLECHHVIELYHIVLGLWKLYGDAEQVFQHALMLHNDDKCESVTLCNDCHGKAHPGRTAPTNQKIRTEIWTVIPRRFPVKLAHSTAHSRDTIGLIGFQTVLGIGWHILNGDMESRIIEFNRRRFAELLDKEPCTSFNNSLEEAIRDLHRIHVIVASHRRGNNIEIHLSANYLQLLRENPWFMSVEDAKASQMCVLALKWFIGMQSNRKHYRIALNKLVVHIGITTKAPSMVAKAIRGACEKISWLSVEIEKGMCSFTIKRKGATPVFSLRQIFEDSLQQGG